MPAGPPDAATKGVRDAASAGMAPGARLRHKVAFPGERAELWAQVVSLVFVR